MTKNNPDVLIVGAGPVGMALACELLQQHVAVRLIDRLPSVGRADPHSRAVLLVPGALELLRRLGVSERLVQAGELLPAINYYSEGRLLGTVRLDQLTETSYPYLVALPQRETERILLARLHELGGTVDRGVTLEEVSGVHDTPVALLRHQNGSRETVYPDWIAGADGTASTTRKMLGIELTGDATDVTYLIADAPIDGPIPTSAHYHYSREGIAAIIPLGNGIYRIAANIPHGSPGGEPQLRESLQGVVDRRTHLTVTVGEPTYSRIVRPKCGVAGAFSRGRCFLLGDAAHVITPAGGQGMNLGLQDAANLGWKLAGVIHGKLNHDILDSYNSERRAAVTRMSAVTARIVGFGRLRGSGQVALRDNAFRAADKIGLVQKLLAPLLTQLDVDYGKEPPPMASWRRGRLRVGQRFPVPFPLLAHRETAAPEIFTVLLWPGRQVNPDWIRTCAAIRKNFQGSARIVDLADQPNPPILRRVLGDVPLMLTVRPDGHISIIKPIPQDHDNRSYLQPAAK